MKSTTQLKKEFQNGEYDDLLTDIYIDKERISYQRQRYVDALTAYEKAYGENEVEIYSAPGRTEVGGNHTDHQHGEVLAASINLDAIAVARRIDEPVAKIISGKYRMITIPLDDLSFRKTEKETTLSLIKGVLAKIQEKGYKLGGFQTYITSDVLIGAGLSSSAAFETIIGTIVSGLYNHMEISPVDIAIIGQYAENVYFGKPCGLMDQMACSVGSLVHIDFKDPAVPVVNQVVCNLDELGYSLCITDTKGSHADLTDDYAAIPTEMKQVAALFGKTVLREVKKEDFYAELPRVRKETGDRAALRAIHFFEENERVEQEVAALKAKDIDEFLQVVTASGNSSFKFLQNVYVNKNVSCQNVSIALAVSETVLKGDGVCRVHGGGFAGTIQAFVKNDAVDEYKKAMDNVFGQGSCNVLKIRKYGGMKVL